MYPTCLMNTLFRGICYPVYLPWLIYQNVFNFATSSKSLHDKVVLITGASSGLGEALAHVCYRNGCQVILSGRRIEELNRVKAELMQIKCQDVVFHDPIVLQLDLSKLPEMDEKVAEMLRLCGHIDILINNGGIGFRGEASSTTIETDIKIMVTNYFGQVALTKAILPFMKAQGSGCVVVISSIQGRFAIPLRSAYAASKHALQAFFDSLRAEIANEGINVLVVSPGYIRTNLSNNAITSSGQTYGIMDETTASGMDPFKVAHKIVKAMVAREQELILAPCTHRLAILLRVLSPSFYFGYMQKRARRLRSTITCESS